MSNRADIKRRINLMTHLATNIVPTCAPEDISPELVNTAEEAIRLAGLGLWDTVLRNPGGPDKTVAQIVEDLRLEEFIDAPAAVSSVKFPQVHVQLSGQDGNPSMIIGRVREAMRCAGIDAAAIAEYTRDARSGDFDHVLQVTMTTVDVD